MTLALEGRRGQFVHGEDPSGDVRADPAPRVTLVVDECGSEGAGIDPATLAMKAVLARS
ncbi:hypothetical protein [Streptomyces sp. NPDC056480]|uniref:hypothetical protein n=1 Tax=Streptomyces sp. NPDC056480 TaxID=3345833 RepID=UPI003674B2B4